MGSILFWLTATAVSIPHARALAGAYAESADCSPSSMLLQAGALQSQLPATCVAPGKSLCEVLPTTVVEKDFTHVRNYSSYSVILKDQAGRSYNVLLDRAFWGAGDNLQPKMIVNVQLVAGNVALIANGKDIARTMDHPEINLHELNLKFVIFGLFSIPVFALFVSWVRRKAKKSRA